jgi:hypothetical protein
LNLKLNESPSTFAFNIDVRRYTAAFAVLFVLLVCTMVWQRRLTPG